MDYYTKLFEYHTAGIVAPGKNRITVCNLEHGDIDEYSFSDTVKAVIYQDLFIDFHNISYYLMPRHNVWGIFLALFAIFLTFLFLYCRICFYHIVKC